MPESADAQPALALSGVSPGMLQTKDLAARCGAAVTYRCYLRISGDSPPTLTAARDSSDNYQIMRGTSEPVGPRHAFHESMRGRELETSSRYEFGIHI